MGTTWQWTIDQVGANSTPPGYGHVYDEVVVTAWSEILGPPKPPRFEIESIGDAVAKVNDPK